MSRYKTINVEIPVPHNVLIFNNIFTSNGYELYLVGGAVRDFLTDKPIKDYDLVTNALPDEIEHILHEANVRTIPTGKHYGIINAFIGKNEYEIATFREDSATGDGRRPDSVTFTNMEVDANRRDLTMNALYYNIDTQEIIDYVGGIDDLINGVVRTVGEPSQRFEEDKLRMLRAIRFAHRIGSDLDPKIDRFLRSGYDLTDISHERIRDEFIKSITSAKSVKSLMASYKEYDMFKWVFPGMSINDDFVIYDDVIIVLTTLLIKNSEEIISKKLNTLTYSINEIRNILFLKRLMTLSPETAPILKKASKVVSLDYYQITEFAFIAGIPKKLVNAFMEFDLTVTGQDVINQYDLKGPELGKKIIELEIENFKKLLS